MAEGKKSFILYCDIKHTVDHLTDQQAGKLFKHIIAYVNDMDPQTKDIRVKLAFEPIKQQLKRDLKEWEDTRHERSESGKIGAAKRWHGKNGIAINTMAKMAVTDNVTVTVNDNVTVIEREDHEKKFRIEDCLRISLNDPRWVKANKATEPELQSFNGYLEKIGNYEYNPKDYKKYFATVKGKYPDLVKKKLTIEEFRIMAAEQDKIEQHG